MSDPERDKQLHAMTRPELIEEVKRVEKVTHTMWTGITKFWGPKGFTDILKYLESKRLKIGQ